MTNYNSKGNEIVNVLGLSSIQMETATKEIRQIWKGSFKGTRKDNPVEEQVNRDESQHDLYTIVFPIIMQICEMMDNEVSSQGENQFFQNMMLEENFTGSMDCEKHKQVVS